MEGTYTDTDKRAFWAAAAEFEGLNTDDRLSFQRYLEEAYLRERTPDYDTPTV
jgi:hypothetical protein